MSTRELDRGLAICQAQAMADHVPTIERLFYVLWENVCALLYNVEHVFYVV